MGRPDCKINALLIFVLYPVGAKLSVYLIMVPLPEEIVVKLSYLIRFHVLFFRHDLTLSCSISNTSIILYSHIKRKSFEQ